MGAALAKQIPALIKRFLKVTKPVRGVTELAGIILHLPAQVMLGIDHLANAREDVGVIHSTQPRGDLRPHNCRQIRVVRENLSNTEIEFRER